MRKRGHLIPMMVFSILAAVLIMVMFQKVAHALATNEQFFKQFQAYEIKFLLHTMYATPGNAIVKYPGNTSNYIYDFETNRLTITSSDIDTSYEKGISLIVPTKDSPINKKLTDINQLVFIKSGRLVDVVDEIEIISDDLKCPTTDVAMKKTVLIIEPKKDNFQVLSTSLAENLKNPSAPFALVKILQPGDEIREDDAFLQISIGKYENDDNPLRIYYRSDGENAKRLACLMANNIAEDFGISDYSIVPSDDPGLKKGVSLHIKIGNSNIQNNPLFDMSKMSSTIKKSYKEC